jgi:LysM repeat protein
MELVFETKTASRLRPVIHETKSQEETAEINVPDSCPDVGRIVYPSAAAVLRGKECQAGSAALAGGVRAGVVYVPEDGSAPRALDAWLPFTIRFDQPALSQDTEIAAQARVRSVDARMINSRKILVRVGIGGELDGWEEESESVQSLSQAPDAVQRKIRTYPLVVPAETAEKPFTVSEDIEVPAGKPDVKTVCAFDALPEITEKKIVGNKAVFKGTLYFKALYLAPDDTFAVLEQQIPFSQYCELQNDYDDEELTVLLAVTGTELETDDSGDARKLLLTVNLLAQCLVSARRPMEVCEDAYALKGTLQPEWTEYAADSRLDSQTLRAPVQGSVKGPVRAVVDSAAYLDFPGQERTQNGLRLRVPANVNVLYLDEQGQLQGGSGKAEASCEIALADTALCRPRAALESGGFAAPGTDGAELRFGAIFEADTFAPQKLRNLSGGTYEPKSEKQEDRPSVVVLANREKQDVWNLAKKYGTTEEAIQKANGLTGPEAEAGIMLLIPM